MAEQEDFDGVPGIDEDLLRYLDGCYNDELDPNLFFSAETRDDVEGFTIDNMDLDDSFINLDPVPISLPRPQKPESPMFRPLSNTHDSSKRFDAASTFHKCALGCPRCATAKREVPIVSPPNNMRNSSLRFSSLSTFQRFPLGGSVCTPSDSSVGSDLTIESLTSSLESKRQFPISSKLETSRKTPRTLSSGPLSSCPSQSKARKNDKSGTKPSFLSFFKKLGSRQGPPPPTSTFVNQTTKRKTRSQKKNVLIQKKIHKKPSPTSKSKIDPDTKRARRVDPIVKKYVTVTAKDVLLGRGGLSNHHPGNKEYRDIILDLQPKYKGLSRNDKTKCSNNVVETIKTKGGRFLKQEGEWGPWYIVTDQTARIKASQALREDHTPEGRAIKKSKAKKKPKTSTKKSIKAN